MGRGRAKAKQVKVARQLKYNSGGMDLDRLQAELAGTDQQNEDRAEPSHDGLADRYADHYADYDDEEDEDEADQAAR